MAGVFDTLRQILTLVHQMSELEKRHATGASDFPGNLNATPATPR